MGLFSSDLKQATIDKYKSMAMQRATPEQIYLAARAEGLSEVLTLKLLRTLYECSLDEAQRVAQIASGNKTHKAITQHNSNDLDEATIAKYKAMVMQGISPKDIYLEAHSEGMPDLLKLKLLRTLYNFSLAEAQQVAHTAFSK